MSLGRRLPSRKDCCRSALPVVLLLLALARCDAEPTVKRLFPEPGSVNICPDTPLRITFEGVPSLGSSGFIRIYRSSDHHPVDSLDLKAPRFTNSVGGRVVRYDPFTVSGNTVSVQLHSHVLEAGESYQVEIDREVFNAGGGTPFEGIGEGGAWNFTTRATGKPAKIASPRITVSSEGSGDFCTLQGAVDAVPDDNQRPVFILMSNGVYNGITSIPRGKNHLHIQGEDRKATLIQGRNNNSLNPGRVGRALFSSDADDLTIENLTVFNTTPYKGSQAEALRIQGNRCILRNSDFRSFQDTLLLGGRIYLTNCLVEGDVDFIWGEGSAFFDSCEITALHNGYYLQSRNPAGTPGYVFLNCKLGASAEVTRCWLARIDAERFPSSSVIFINCTMGTWVPTAGWDIQGTNTSGLGFSEFRSKDASGKPVDVSRRHPASRQLSESEAMRFSDPSLILSLHDDWNPQKSP